MRVTVRVRLSHRLKNRRRGWGESYSEALKTRVGVGRVVLGVLGADPPIHIMTPPYIGLGLSVWF